MQKISFRMILISVLFIGALFGIWYFDLTHYVSLSFLQEKIIHLHRVVSDHYAMALMMYIICFGIIVACMIPAVGPLTLLGGYLFGTIVGTGSALLALIGGITISFLTTRYFLASVLPAKWISRRETFARRIREYGAWYIFTLNVVTIIPSIVISVLAALSDISLLKFLCASAAGSLPMLAMYAFAGRKFAEISSVSEIFSPSFIIILVSLAVLSCIPMIIKRVTNVSIDDV